MHCSLSSCHSFICCHLYLNDRIHCVGCLLPMGYVIETFKNKIIMFGEKIKIKTYRFSYFIPELACKVHLAKRLQSVILELLQVDQVCYLESLVLQVQQQFLLPTTGHHTQNPLYFGFRHQLGCSFELMCLIDSPNH